MAEALMSSLLVLLAGLLVRNEIVYVQAIRRIDEVHTYNQAMIRRGVFDSYYAYPNENTLLLILDLSKWTYRQFYPEALDASNASTKEVTS